MTIPKDALKFDTPDSTGKVPDLGLLYSKWQHFKGGMYEIIDYDWDAERDVWIIRYRPIGGIVKCTRSIENFHSEAIPGIQRFTRAFTDFERRT